MTRLPTFSRFCDLPVYRYHTGVLNRGGGRLSRPQQDDSIQFTGPSSIRTALRMRFPAGREFVFEVSYDSDIPAEVMFAIHSDQE